MPIDPLSVFFAGLSATKNRKQQPTAEHPLLQLLQALKDPVGESNRLGSLVGKANPNNPFDNGFFKTPQERLAREKEYYGESGGLLTAQEEERKKRVKPIAAKPVAAPLKRGFSAGIGLGSLLK